jgi:hypothetical protein
MEPEENNLEYGMEANVLYLAKPCPYHRATKNCIYDLHIFQGDLWGDEDMRCGERILFLA